MSTQPITKRSITGGNTQYVVQSDGRIVYRTIVGVGWTAWFHVETIARGANFQGAVGLFLRDDGLIGVLDRRGDLSSIEVDSEGRHYAIGGEREVAAPPFHVGTGDVPAPPLGKGSATAGPFEGTYVGLAPNAKAVACRYCGFEHEYMTVNTAGEDAGGVCLPVLWTRAVPWHAPTVPPTHGMQVMAMAENGPRLAVVWREDAFTDERDEARIAHRVAHRERLAEGRPTITRTEPEEMPPTEFVRIPLDRIGEYQFDTEGYLIVEESRTPADEDPISGHELPHATGEHATDEEKPTPIPERTAAIRLGDGNHPEMTFRFNPPRTEIRTDQEFDPILRPVTRNPLTAAADLCRQALPQLVAMIIKLTNTADGRGLDPSQVYTLLETAAISLHADADHEEETGVIADRVRRESADVPHTVYADDRERRTGVIPGRPGQGGRS